MFSDLCIHVFILVNFIKLYAWPFLVNIINLNNFFSKVFGGHTCLFLGATGTPFWISGGISSKPEWVLPYSLFCGGKCNVHSLRSTSGATLANLLAASVQPVVSPHTVVEVRLSGFKLVLSEYL